MIERDQAITEGFRLAWRYCYVTELVAVIILLILSN